MIHKVCSEISTKRREAGYQEDYGKNPLHFAAAKGKLNTCQLLVSMGADIDALDDRMLTPLHWSIKEERVSVSYFLLEKGANVNLQSGNLFDCGETPLHFAAARGKVDRCQFVGSKHRTAPLHFTAAQGKLGLCQLLVSTGAYIDAVDDRRRTPLHWAVKADQVSVANFLLEKGANPNEKAYNLFDCGQTPLHFAAARGRLDLCQLLVSKGAYIESLDNKKRTCIHLAAKEGHISVVNYLLEKGADGKTALHLAAAEGRLDMCQLLVSKGTYIDGLDHKRRTPLYWAIKEDRVSVTNFLLEKGASIDWELHCERTSLHFAAARGKLDICQLLVSKGAHIDALDYGRRAPLHWAVKERHTSVVNYLLKKGADALTALHSAAAGGRLDMCQILVLKGSHIDALDHKERTPLHWAIIKDQVSVTNFLLEKGANLNLKAGVLDYGQTPLHFAAAEGKIDICQLLVSKGAHIDSLDNQSCTPLHLAAKKLQISAANYLLEKGANVAPCKCIFYSPKKTKYEYRKLLRNLLKKYTMEEIRPMKLFLMFCNLVFNESNKLKSIARHVIVNYACQGKAYDTVDQFNIPQCLKSYLTFEEELRTFF